MMGGVEEGVGGVAACVVVEMGVVEVEDGKCCAKARL
jgi:hypothetical protein